MYSLLSVFIAQKHSFEGHDRVSGLEQGSETGGEPDGRMGKGLGWPVVFLFLDDVIICAL